MRLYDATDTPTEYAEHCDRHASAWARARVTLPSGGVLYVCGHCAGTLNFGDEYVIEYGVVEVEV
jgi:predicted SprT family Zn-dependent metalloprotease